MIERDECNECLVNKVILIKIPFCKTLLLCISHSKMNHMDM